MLGSVAVLRPPQARLLAWALPGSPGSGAFPPLPPSDTHDTCHLPAPASRVAPQDLGQLHTSQHSPKPISTHLHRPYPSASSPPLATSQPAGRRPSGRQQGRDLGDEAPDSWPLPLLCHLPGMPFFPSWGGSWDRKPEEQVKSGVRLTLSSQVSRRQRHHVPSLQAGGTRRPPLQVFWKSKIISP